jgi:nicotinate-nucleotide adenylyltransferase
VVLRRSTAADDPSGPDSADDQHDGPGFPVRHLATRQVDVSSTEIRERVREGRSIRGFVTDAVADYIASTGLYIREPTADNDSARA